MEKEYFKASEDLQLLRDWSNNRHDPKEYEKNEQRARKAAARLFNSGVLVFERGDKPRTASEFPDKKQITFAVTKQGKISVLKYDVFEDEKGHYIEYGYTYEKIYIDELKEVQQ